QCILLSSCIRHAIHHDIHTLSLHDALPICEPTASNGFVYIGDAVFVAGARPDVETAYPNAPFNYRAGWGYLMLTTGLPNNGGSPGPGNGTYKLDTIAHSKAGRAVDLGTRHHPVDNQHAPKQVG